MSYAPALDKAWKDIAAETSEERFSIKFISDTYDIDIAQKRILSVSCNSSAKDYTSIILLHYLIKKLTLGNLPALTGDWKEFRELAGGEAYYPAFKKRTIDHILTKYGSNPDALLSATERMNAKRSGLGDVGIVIYPFDQVALLVKISRADEEFGADGAILFDSNIEKIFCMEDIVVLTEIIVHQL